MSNESSIITSVTLQKYYFLENQGDTLAIHICFGSNELADFAGLLNDNTCKFLPALLCFHRKQKIIETSLCFEIQITEYS